MAGGKSKDKQIRLPYQAKLNPEYKKQDFIETFQVAFKDKKHLAHENKVILYNEPFQCCQMPDFISDRQFLESLKEEVLDQIFLEKNNDLYKFQQTLDFETISTPHIKQIRKLLHDEFLSWLSDVTGFTFTDQIDLTASRYDHTDVLLCHDDELDTRRIAFVLYLVPPWSADDGGMLDLFDMDEYKQPKDIVRSLIPSWNTLVWFEVTEASHHQVSEVLSHDKCRLSVHGWFHTAPVPRPERHVELTPELYPYITTEEDLLSEWINPVYLDPEVQARIQMTFEKDSEIELQGFIKEEKYQQLRDALCNKDIVWSLQGPPNKRHYDVADENSLPEIVKQCKDFLRSEQMFLTLSNLTGLTLHKLASDIRAISDGETSESLDDTSGGSTSTCDPMPEENTGSIEKDLPEKRRKVEKLCKEQDHSKEINPLCRAEVRRWRHRCYTLLHDTEVVQAEFALDAMLFCCCKGWRQECGGYTSYITRGEDEELLSVQPAENSLALVYRDKDTLRFVKYVNSKISELAGGESFYDFYVVYYE